MGDFHFMDSKNYYVLKEKLKEISSLKEKMVLLESEKLNTQRVLHHLKSKKHSLITFIRYKGRMYSPNCPELHDISRYISEISSKKIDYVKNKLGPFFIFYKYGYIYPVYNFLLYLQGYYYFKRLYSGYLLLVKQEITFCEKQINLGFNETPIKSLDQPYQLKYSPRQLSTKIKSKKEISDYEKLSKVIVKLDHYWVFDKDNFEQSFDIVFITKKSLLDELKNYYDTKEKLIYLFDIRNILVRLKTEYEKFDPFKFDGTGIYLFELLQNCPELVFFIELNAEMFKEDKLELNLFLLKNQIELRTKEYEEVIELINSQIDYFEKRLSLESAAPEIEPPQNQLAIVEKPVKPITQTKKKKKYINEIIWLGNETQLIDFFFDLNNATLVPKYSDDEVLSHFVNERRQKFESLQTVSAQTLQWLGTDEEFAYFVTKLNNTGIIKVSNKYKAFTAHFLNREGKVFKNLPQKYTNLKNHGTSNPQIDDAIKNINKDKSY